MKGSHLHHRRRIDIERVHPPPGLLPARALDEGDAVGGRQRHAEAVAGDVLRVDHFEDFGHVEHAVRDRLRLQGGRRRRSEHTARSGPGAREGGEGSGSRVKDHG